MKHKITKPTLAEILNVVLAVLNIDEQQWEACRKTRQLTAIQVREFYSLLAYEHGYSPEKIGRFIGLHRTSVMARIKTIKGYCSVYPKQNELLDKARVRLQEYVRKEQVEDLSISFLSRSSTGLLTISPIMPSRVCGYWIAEGSRPYYPQTAFPQITWDSDPKVVKIKVTIEDHEEM